MIGDKASNDGGTLNWMEHAIIRVLAKVFGKKK